ncbi:MAG: hypothetical protein AAF928_21710, partial [Myxococcota bacterium]
MTSHGRARAAATTLVFALGGVPSSALGSGFEDFGQDLRGEPESVFGATGLFRARANALYNLDLDRGPTPSGELLFPVPQSDGTGQTLTFADMRLRSDLSAYWPSGGAAIKVRVDALDNLVLGSAPTGIPAASTTQDDDSGFLTIKRAYAEVLTPLGFIAFGRMGAQWGLGMLSNGGDCLDCDSGDAADRFTYILPALDHLFIGAYDFSSTAPTVPHQTETRAIAVEPTAMVHTVTFAVMHFTTDESRRRRRRAGRFTFDYGALATHRWQTNDIPALYLPVAGPAARPATSDDVPADQLMMRGYRATAADVWLRFVGPDVRLELEAAYLNASVAQPSLIPGVRLRDPVTSDQFGFAFQSDFGDREDVFSAGFDAGVASGDPAPGFGAYPVAGQAAPQAGDFDGPQSIPPFDNRVDNFAFHPDYRVDRILFREIIGRITDAFYLRPHARITLAESRTGRLAAELWGIVSGAMEPSSTPGGARMLGVEL